MTAVHWESFLLFLKVCFKVSLKNQCIFYVSFSKAIVNMILLDRSLDSSLSRPIFWETDASLPIFQWTHSEEESESKESSASCKQLFIFAFPAEFDRESLINSQTFCGTLLVLRSYVSAQINNCILWFSNTPHKRFITALPSTLTVLFCAREETCYIVVSLPMLRPNLCPWLVCVCFRTTRKGASRVLKLV